MNFETAFAHYQAHTATAEETALVERELEKYRLIEDYLAEQELPELPEDAAAAASAETKAEKRRQNRRKPFDILFHLQNYACFRTCIPGQRDAGKRDVTCRHNPTVRHGYSWYFRRSSKDRDNNRQTTGSAGYRSSPFRKQPDI